MGTNPSQFKGANQPVEYVNWVDIQLFIELLNNATGKNYRLPTEAEWEYAARGGKQGINNKYRYSGSNDIGAVAWYYDGPGSNKTHPVGQKEPNELGLYDMTGNVFEWCNDWYELYTLSPKTNPQGAASGDKRVFRGGSWFTYEEESHITSRGYNSPSYRERTLGFRLALSVNK